MRKKAPAAQQQKSPTVALINYREVDAIFRAYPLEGTTRFIYINEARRASYLTVLTSPPLIMSKPIMFSEANDCAVHFPHNNALTVTMHIDNCGVSRILVDNESSVNIYALWTEWRTPWRRPEP